MIAPGVLDALVSLGGLSGLGSLLAALAAYRKAAQGAAQLRPDHGTTVADGIGRIEDAVRSLGHQIGEIRVDMAEERRDRRAGDEALADRLQTIETRRR